MLAKSKHTDNFISCHQKTGQSHNTSAANKSKENVATLKIFGKESNNLKENS
jgi:hypothetical protein